MKNLLAILGRTHPAESSLSAYVDRRLEAEPTAQIEAHLAGCGACGLRLEALRGLHSALASLPEFEPPRSYRLTAADVSRTAPTKASGGRDVTFRAIPALAGMAIIAFAALIVVDLRSSGSSNSNSDATLAYRPPATTAAEAPQPALSLTNPTAAPADASKSQSNGVTSFDSATSSGSETQAGAAAAPPASVPSSRTVPEGTSAGAAASDGIAPAGDATPPAERASEAPTPAAARPEADGSGGGHDWLRVSEAGVAATALTLVVASVIGARRRREE